MCPPATRKGLYFCFKPQDKEGVIQIPGCRRERAGGGPGQTPGGRRWWLCCPLSKNQPSHPGTEALPGVSLQGLLGAPHPSPAQQNQAMSCPLTGGPGGPGPCSWHACCWRLPGPSRVLPSVRRLQKHKGLHVAGAAFPTGWQGKGGGRQGPALGAGALPPLGPER